MKLKKSFVICIGVLLLVAPAVAFGALGDPVPSAPSFGGSGVPSVSSAPSGGDSSFRLMNPLAVNSICGLIKSILQAVLVIGLPIAVLFLIFAGLKYVAALGNPEKINEANSNLMWTVVGIAIFLGAALIAQVIATTIGQVSSRSGAGFQDVGSCN